MAFDPWGFLTYRREDALVRPVGERVKDWRAVSLRPSDRMVQHNAARCMDCGVAFCEYGCPLGNQIPLWTEPVAASQWRRASDALHATNNFPEFTGWLCPAPCEPSCVLAINADPVAIRQIELAIVDRAFEEGWIRPHRPLSRTGHRVAIVGSGPAGLAAAQQLTRAGHHVTVFERDDRIGGLLRYGIPDFKIEKRLVDRRLEQMACEGTRFAPTTDVGSDLAVDELRRRFDAVILACGATRRRQLDVPGATLRNVHQAIPYLTGANRVQNGDLAHPPIDAAARHVLIIGGGDTAIDCLGTANRQRAASVTVLDHNPTPPEARNTVVNPWPEWPIVHRTGFAHAEGVHEEWQAEVRQLLSGGAGQVCSVRLQRVQPIWTGGTRHFESIPGAGFQISADLVLLAMGFDGVERGPLVDDLDLALNPDGTVTVDEEWATSAPRVFACGDATRGASLVVWAIADGRACAAAVHAALTGDESLPRPVNPTSGAVRVA